MKNIISGECTRIRGFFLKATKSYFREVKRFFELTGKGTSPQKVNEDLLRKYFFHLQEKRNYSIAALKISY